MNDDRPLEGEDAAVAAVLALLDGGTALSVGPGHDCAVVASGGDEVVLTTDVLVDGVHFHLAACGPEAAGEKSLLVNLSDLAAAAAVPLAFEVGVVLPTGVGRNVLEGLARGLARAARRWACPCAGGDTNVADAPLTLAVMVVGRPGPAGVVTRAGAREGDVLSVTGPLGGSLSGRHLAFTPRLEEAEVLARMGIPHAMMDVSDGLSRDLPRLCRASGVGAVVEAEQIPVHPDAMRLDDDRPALEHALHDGEDFELLLAHAPLAPGVARELEHAGVRLHGIGRILAAREGIVLREEGETRPLIPRGYDHFER